MTTCKQCFHKIEMIRSNNKIEIIRTKLTYMSASKSCRHVSNVYKNRNNKERTYLHVSIKTCRHVSKVDENRNNKEMKIEIIKKKLTYMSASNHADM